MRNIHIVGCGALGSNLALEIAKRSIATDQFMEIYLYDDDKVEQRNLVTQLFDEVDVEQPKASCLVDKLRVGYNRIKFISCDYRVNEETAPAMKLDSQSVIIDVVDNITSRHFLWKLGMMRDVPVLHAAMAQSGSGRVDWNFRDKDTFHLSPKNVSPKALQEIVNKEEDKKLAPCMLNSFRGLILNTVIATNNALFTFFGRDVTKDCDQLTDGKPLPGLMTTWNVTTNGHSLVKELTQYVEQD